MTDIKLCPIPLENPIKGLSDYGQTLIAASTNLMATSVMLSFTKYATVKYKTSKLLRDKGGKINSADKIGDSLVDDATKGSGFVGKAVKFIAKGFNLAGNIIKRFNGCIITLTFSRCILSLHYSISSIHDVYIRIPIMDNDLSIIYIYRSYVDYI